MKSDTLVPNILNVTFLREFLFFCFLIGLIKWFVYIFAVSPAWEEPCQGWVDSLNGPIGIMVGGAKGVIRTMLCNGEYRSEVIPVDIAINGLIAIGYKIATTKQK